MTSTARRTCWYCPGQGSDAETEMKPYRGTWKFHSVAACAAHTAMARREMEARHGNLTVRRVDWATR